MRKALLIPLIFLCTVALSAMAQFPAAGTDDYLAMGRITLQTGTCPVETIDLNGTVKVHRGSPFDPGDGRDEIPTEMIQMSLTGSAPCNGPVIVKVQLAPAPASIGRIKAQNISPDYPAFSFFDVYVEIELVSLTLVSSSPITISGVINNIPWLGETHSGFPPVPIDLHDKATGTLMGQLSTFSWTPIGINTCPPGPAFCDSVRTAPCLLICPASDIVYRVVLKDSCGNPVCDTVNTWLDFSQCNAIPCPGEEPFWPNVFPDSCDPATGTHFFTVDAGQQGCTTCPVGLIVNGFFCRIVEARFFDTNGDLCVFPNDLLGGPCNDYDCDGLFTPNDQTIFDSHLDHCCTQPCPPGPPFCDSTKFIRCLNICPRSDVVWVAVLKDSCGNPVCDTIGTFLDFSNCPAVPCPNEEPLWPQVRPDSCNPISGEHYFTVDASLVGCTDCFPILFVNFAPCVTVQAMFYDVDGDFCVTVNDFTGLPCNDYNCNGQIDADDIGIHNLHKGHCCPGAPCPPGPAFCDSVRTDPCLVICPASDIVYKVVLKDSCGNPVCDTIGTFLDFSNCPAFPCPGEEPNWPIVRPDSCDPATGTHYFTVDAGMDVCVPCAAVLFVNNQPCRDIPAYFLDVNGDLCVTDADLISAGFCNDYNCDGQIDADDIGIHNLHKGHCCPGGPCPPGPAFCDSIFAEPCILICPKSDVVYQVVVKDSCGNPLCDTLGIWLDFAQCPAQPCLDHEPVWPRVLPDSCDPATGTHYFTVDAGLLDCTICQVGLFVNGALCRVIQARFFDINGDLCVTGNDFIGQVCNDYDCDGQITPADRLIFDSHLNHCCCDCKPGDANGSGSYNILDATYIVSYLFKNGPPPTPYRICSGDANCDCVVNILDATYLIAYLFKNGPAPCTCEEWVAKCGLPLRKQ